MPMLHRLAPALLFVCLIVAGPASVEARFDEIEITSHYILPVQSAHIYTNITGEGLIHTWGNSASGSCQDQSAGTHLKCTAWNFSLEECAFSGQQLPIHIVASVEASGNPSDIATSEQTVYYTCEVNPE